MGTIGKVWGEIRRGESQFFEGTLAVWKVFFTARNIFYDLNFQMKKQRCLHQIFGSWICFLPEKSTTRLPYPSQGPCQKPEQGGLAAKRRWCPHSTRNPETGGGAIKIKRNAVSQSPWRLPNSQVHVGGTATALRCFLPF